MLERICEFVFECNRVSICLCNFGICIKFEKNFVNKVFLWFFFLLMFVVCFKKVLSSSGFICLKWCVVIMFKILSFCDFLFFNNLSSLLLMVGWKLFFDVFFSVVKLMLLFLFILIKYVVNRFLGREMFLFIFIKVLRKMFE